MGPTRPALPREPRFDRKHQELPGVTALGPDGLPTAARRARGSCDVSLRPRAAEVAPPQATLSDERVTIWPHPARRQVPRNTSVKPRDASHQAKSMRCKNLRISETALPPSGAWSRSPREGALRPVTTPPPPVPSYQERGSVGDRRSPRRISCGSVMGRQPNQYSANLKFMQSQPFPHARLAAPCSSCRSRSRSASVM